jgi:hypothetical protein
MIIKKFKSNDGHQDKIYSTQSNQLYFRCNAAYIVQILFIGVIFLILFSAFAFLLLSSYCSKISLQYLIL